MVLYTTPIFSNLFKTNECIFSFDVILVKHFNVNNIQTQRMNIACINQETNAIVGWKSYEYETTLRFSYVQIAS